MEIENQRNFQGGLSKIYIWGIVNVLMLYAGPVLAWMNLPHTTEVNSQAEYEEYARLQNGSLGSTLPVVILWGIPVLLLLFNTIISLYFKNLDRRYFLGNSILIKYSLTPFYLFWGFVSILSTLLMIVPVIGLAITGGIWFVSGVLCWLSMISSLPLTVAYLRCGYRDGKNGKPFSVIIGIMQVFPGLDILGTVIAAFKEKRYIKATLITISADVFWIIIMVAFVIIRVFKP